jgi:hypothetical protein
MNRRRLVVLALATPLITLAPVQAWAYYAFGSSPVNGTVVADSLGVPTASATQNLLSETITVSTKPGSGPTPTGYRVDRLGSNAATGICTITGSTGSCTDTTLALGNKYAVYATLDAWTAVSPANPTASVLPTAYILDSGASATAGAPDSVIIKATLLGLLDTGYTGTQSVLITGASNGPNGTPPVLPTSANFVNGQATVSLTLFKAGVNNLVFTVGGSTATPNPKPISVSAGAPAAYTLTAPATVKATGSNKFSLSAVDAYGNAYSGTQTVTWAGGPTGTTYPSSTVTFPNGTNGEMIDFKGTAGTFTITAATSGITTGSVTVTAG